MEQSHSSPVLLPSPDVCCQSQMGASPWSAWGLPMPGVQGTHRAGCPLHGQGCVAQAVGGAECPQGRVLSVQGTHTAGCVC